MKFQMLSNNREKYSQCPCCNECEDCSVLQTTLDIQGAGLVICQPTTQNQLNTNTEPDKPTAHDIVILQNTKDKKIMSCHISAEELQNINCPRCKYIIEHAKKRMQSKGQNYRTAVIGVCNHCRNRSIPQISCHECEDIAKKFITSISEGSVDTGQKLKTWLSQIKYLLKATKVAEEGTHENIMPVPGPKFYPKKLQETKQTTGVSVDSQIKMRPKLKTYEDDKDNNIAQAKPDIHRTKSYESYLDRPEKSSHVKGTSLNTEIRYGSKPEDISRAAHEFYKFEKKYMHKSDKLGKIGIQELEDINTHHLPTDSQVSKGHISLPGLRDYDFFRPTYSHVSKRGMAPSGLRDYESFHPAEARVSKRSISSPRLHEYEAKNKTYVAKSGRRQVPDIEGRRTFLEDSDYRTDRLFGSELESRARTDVKHYDILDWEQKKGIKPLISDYDKHLQKLKKHDTIDKDKDAKKKTAKSVKVTLGDASVLTSSLPRARSEASVQDFGKVFLSKAASKSVTELYRRLKPDIDALKSHDYLEHLVSSTIPRKKTAKRTKDEDTTSVYHSPNIKYPSVEALSEPNIPERLLRKDFSYQFPKEVFSKKKFTRLPTSAELIKETQDMLKLKEEEKREKHEIERLRKLLEDDIKNKAREEKKRLKEEKRKEEEERKLIQDKEKKRAEEERRRLEEEKRIEDMKLRAKELQQSREDDQKKTKGKLSEEEKQKSKEDKDKARAERERAKEERKKEEDEKRRAKEEALARAKEEKKKEEDEKRRAKEEARERAKEERKKAEEEKLRAKEEAREKARLEKLEREKAKSEKIDEEKVKSEKPDKEKANAEKEADKLQKQKEKEIQLQMEKEEKQRQQEAKQREKEEKQREKEEKERLKKEKENQLRAEKEQQQLQKEENKNKPIAGQKGKSDKDGKISESQLQEVEKPEEREKDEVTIQEFKKIRDESYGKDEVSKKKKEEQLEKSARDEADKKAKEIEKIGKMRGKEAKAAIKPEPAKQVKIEKQNELPLEKELDIKQVKVRRPSYDDLILKLVRLKQSEPREKIKQKSMPVLDYPFLAQEHKKHKYNKTSSCLMCVDSEFELDVEDILLKIDKPKEIGDIIVGQNIFKYKPPFIEKEEKAVVVPSIFQSTFQVESPIESKIKPDIVGNEEHQIKMPAVPVKSQKTAEQEVPKGIIRYSLSDRAFIEKGWTMLPTEKVVRKMNVYRMRPAHPEFDWFEHNKKKKLMLYDTGEKLADFDDDGRSRLYYKNGRLALDYYDAEEINAQQRFVIFSSGELDERGRSHPITILATFDYLGNGIVFDHGGKIRLKYNQTEGVVLDRNIGPVSHWKWHTLNDPPVLQKVMIDTQMAHKDPDIVKMGGQSDNKSRPDNEDMLAIEFDNFIKEKSKKLTQTFKPFQIKMKALKINEHFSLRILDQATIYLIYRDNTTNVKFNIGMILDHKEIVDTDTAEVGEVSNSLERFPARTDSLAGLQRSVAYAQRFEKARLERDRRLRPPEPCTSADQLTAGISRPLRPPLRTVSSSSTTAASSCKCSRKPYSSNVYYDTRLI